SPTSAVDPSGTLFGFFERSLKAQGFLFWRTFVVTSPHWRDLLEAWYFETGPNPVILAGIADPRNADIAANIGFQRLLTCWFARNLSGAAVPPGRWVVDAAGFQWQYAYDFRSAAGGPAAYTPTPNFLGSYRANISLLRRRPGLCDVSVTVLN